MNKRIAVIVGIIFIVLIGFGGKIYMDKKAEEKAREEQRNLLETERESAVVLKETFTNIKSVKFTDSYGPDSQTGSYVMDVILTNLKGESLQFRFSYWKERKEMGTYVIESEEIQSEGITRNKIKVILTDGKEMQI